MSQTVNITAASRDRAGKGAARAIRREGRVPGVIYGDKKDPQLVSLEYRELIRAYFEALTSDITAEEGAGTP